MPHHASDFLRLYISKHKFPLGNPDVIRSPHGYADMNISMDIFMNLTDITDMNTIIFSWIISMNIHRFFYM